MIGKVVSYFRSSAEELKKVSWPGRAKTIKLTIYVVLISLGVSVYLGLLDDVFFRTMSLVIKK